MDKNRRHAECIRIRQACLAVLVCFVSACSGPDQAATPLPCEVLAVFEAKCNQCHNERLEFGAPMQLLTWDDTQIPTPTKPEVLVWQEIDARIHRQELPMPPVGLPSLNFDEHAILEAWFMAKAPPGDSQCQ